MLLQCPECGNAISQHSAQCPKCGCPNYALIERKKELTRKEQTNYWCDEQEEKLDDKISHHIWKAFVHSLLLIGFFVCGWIFKYKFGYDVEVKGIWMEIAAFIVTGEMLMWLIYCILTGGLFGGVLFFFLTMLPFAQFDGADPKTWQIVLAVIVFGGIAIIIFLTPIMHIKKVFEYSGKKKRIRKQTVSYSEEEYAELRTLEEVLPNKK